MHTRKRRLSTDPASNRSPKKATTTPVVTDEDEDSLEAILAQIKAHEESEALARKLQEEWNNTKVNVETDMKLTGRAAQFGRGIAQDVATKMLDQFADCLEEEIVNGGAARGQAVSGAQPSANGSSGEGSSGGARQQDDVEALDLGEASRDAVMARIKPAIPLVVGGVALLLVLRLLRGGGSSDDFGKGSGMIEARVRF